MRAPNKVLRLATSAEIGRRVYWGSLLPKEVGPFPARDRARVKSVAPSTADRATPPISLECDRSAAAWCESERDALPRLGINLSPPLPCGAKSVLLSQHGCTYLICMPMTEHVLNRVSPEQQVLSSAATLQRIVLVMGLMHKMVHA